MKGARIVPGTGKPTANINHNCLVRMGSPATEGAVSVKHLSSLCKALCLIPSILKKKKKSSWTWWHLPVILALGRHRQEGHKFKASQGYK
jgi:hypothetical protein